MTSSSIKRKNKFRIEKKIYLIVCEGKKTEPSYFYKLREPIRNAVIKPISSDENDPIGVVNYAIERFKRITQGSDRILKKDIFVWCVFDVDNSSERQVRKALDIAKKHNVNIALSNPCFELWYLLHFEQIKHYVTPNEVIERLKKYIPNYKKCDCKFFGNICEHKDKAIERAEFLNRIYEEQGKNIYSIQSNPCTQVFRVVKEIESLHQRVEESTTVKV